ncbi:hypothetical protein [Infirmifilum sp. NZ]|uniref:hypothetical protein n=1 Tax=Infirmifilum sp. NZ TaxID=2926850 RepID=UPI0027AB1DF4|nr:hypothetical protein [Infirmifilum sp. NZ]UNQ73764.1 hypothetical protein MOV14_01815 [Infirmifilum sp. NZ]
MSGGVLPDRCVKNAAVFDPDMPYTFTSALLEVDYLCECDENDPDPWRLLAATGIPKGRYLLVEDVSKAAEIAGKVAKRSLLTLTPVPSELWVKVNTPQSGGYVEVPAPAHLAFSEIINMLFYSALLLPEDEAKNIAKWIRELLGSLGVTGGESGSVYQIVKALHDHGNFITEKLRNHLTKVCKTLSSLCSKSAWVVLVQKGMEEYRLRKVLESIEILASLLRCGQPENGGPDRVCYISQEVQSFLKSRGIEFASLAGNKCKVLIQVDKNDLLKDLSNSGYCENVLFIVFGDYAKAALKQVLDSQARHQVLVVNESFYAPYSEVPYGVKSFYGYLKAVEQACYASGGQQPLFDPQQLLGDCPLASGLSDKELCELALLLARSVVVETGGGR